MIQCFAIWVKLPVTVLLSGYIQQPIAKTFLKSTYIWRYVCHLAFFILCEASLSYSSLLLFWNYCAPDCFVAHYRGSYDQITAFSMCVCVCFSHNISICKLEPRERESSNYSNGTEQNGRDSPVGTNVSWHITYPGALCALECLYSLFLLILSVDILYIFLLWCLMI